jgi:hypothetical protein
MYRSSNHTFGAENSTALREVHAKLAHLYAEKDAAASQVRKHARELHALLAMMAQMDLIVSNTKPASDIGQAAANSNTPPLKFGASAALLLDPRTLSYFDSLGDFFNHSLPNMLHRLGLGDQRAEVFSDSISKLERRNREYEVASRPFVEERFNTLTQQLGLLEKATSKRLRVELKKFEADFAGRVAKERAEEKIGAETSIARVHFRCVACDQPVASQPGPMSKEYQQQVVLHNQQVHGIQSQQPLHLSTSMVGGFATPVPQLLSSSLSTPLGSGLPGSSTTIMTSNPHSSGIGVVSADRGHMFIDPGQRTTVHSNTDATVYRGREDTRISFTPAAPTGHADQRQTATFQTAYTKVSCVHGVDDAVRET